MKKYLKRNKFYFMICVLLFSTAGILLLYWFLSHSFAMRKEIAFLKEENQYFRIDISENYDNYPMFWGYSSMRAFQSIVPGSIMEFYPQMLRPICL